MASPAGYDLGFMSVTNTQHYWSLVPRARERKKEMIGRRDVLFAVWYGLRRLTWDGEGHGRNSVAV